MLGCTPFEPETTPVSMAADCRLLGVGSGVYYGRMHPDLLAWLKQLPDASHGGRSAFIYSTSGLSFLSGVWHWPLRRLLARKGFDVVGEFACRGFDTWGPLWFTGGLNRRHPDERDLARARAFAEQLAAGHVSTQR